MPHRPKPLGKPSSKLPMYDVTKGRGSSTAAGMLDPADRRRSRRPSSEPERRARPSRPQATYPRRTSLTPRGATVDTAGRAERLKAIRDRFKARVGVAKPGVKEKVISTIRSNKAKIGAVAGKAARFMPPIAAAGAAHNLVGILVEGDRALAAKAKVMREKRYTRKHYGTEAKAARTRREGPRR